MGNKGQIARGEKWARVRKVYILKNQDKQIEWLDSQESIVNDEKAYADSLEPVKEEAVKETKSKKVK